ncbi:hypothetical protein SNE40_009821 [Patella caerulea]|uniref:Endonuclease-reverse transcriptase n=1 Tax=Patella caerulea TaxID=87958 RepID=A0AAN8Q3R3_PATCE
MLKHCISKIGNKSVKVVFKLFDAMIIPILTYGAEIWGTCPRESIETVQNKLCKWILNLGNKTPNILARQECGRHELHVIYMAKPIIYFLKIQEMHEDRLPRHCYNMLYSLDEAGRKTWCTNVRSLLYEIGFGYAQGVGSIKAFRVILKQRLRDINIQEVSANLQKSNKYRFYTQINDRGIRVAEYLSVVPQYLRFYLSILRCSTHNLEVEVGRRSGVEYL